MLASVTEKLQMLLLLCPLLFASARLSNTITRKEQPRDLLGDALFDLDLVDSENPSVNLEIPGEETSRYYHPQGNHYYKGQHYKGAKGSKSGKSSKSKGSKSKKGSKGYYPGYKPGKGNNNGGGYTTHPGSNGGYTTHPGDSNGGGGGTTQPGGSNGVGGTTAAPGDGGTATTTTSEEETQVTGGALNCDAIRKGLGATGGPQTTLQGKMDVVFYPATSSKDDVLTFIYGVMNDYVRVRMAGCEVTSTSRGVAETNTANATIINIVMSATEESLARGACTTGIANAECMKTDTTTDVYHGATGSTTYLATNLNDAIDEAIRTGQFSGLSGIESVVGPDGQTMYSNPNADPGDTNETQDEDEDENENEPAASKAVAATGNEGLGVAAKTVIPIAAVTLFLLMVLFLRKRHQENMTRTRAHGQKDSLLDTDTDDETEANRPPLFYNDDSDSVSTGPFDDGSFYGDSALGKNQSTMDVHVCQSSLCEACGKGSGGISFIKTGAPRSPERLPKDATRDYSESDTVSL